MKLWQVAVLSLLLAFGNLCGCSFRPFVTEADQGFEMVK